jgi:hypothetical protein
MSHDNAEEKGKPKKTIIKKDTKENEVVSTVPGAAVRRSALKGRGENVRQRGGGNSDVRIQVHRSRLQEIVAARHDDALAANRPPPFLFSPIPPALSHPASPQDWEIPSSTSSNTAASFLNRLVCVSSDRGRHLDFLSQHPALVTARFSFPQKSEGLILLDAFAAVAVQLRGRHKAAVAEKKNGGGCKGKYNETRRAVKKKKQHKKNHRPSTREARQTTPACAALSCAGQLRLAKIR